MNSLLFHKMEKDLETSPRANLYPIMFAVIISLAILGCSGPEQASSASPAPAETWFPLRIGETELSIQLALSVEEQRRGLMHRESLEENEGMVFLFPRPGPRSFWMKNTRIPLDIGYFGPDGTLMEVHPLYPFDETRVSSTSNSIQIAIETNQGWFRANGIRPGAQIDLSQLEAAVRLRGGDYSSFLIHDTQP